MLVQIMGMSGQIVRTHNSDHVYLYIELIAGKLKLEV